jgi:NAD(P)-dependent dehydrogenase (short-subunit alcohol dehydrogenase family)
MEREPQDRQGAGVTTISIPRLFGSIAGTPSGLGVKMHNAAYTAAGLEAQYIAFGTDDLAAVLSLGGRVGSPEMTAYQSAKWAVGGFSEALAAEVAPSSRRPSSTARHSASSPVATPTRSRGPELYRKAVPICTGLPVQQTRAGEMRNGAGR